MPWHASPIVCTNGDVKTAYAKDLRNPSEANCELVMRNGKPSYFRERSEQYEGWKADVELRHEYSGLLVKNLRNEVQPLEKEYRMKLARLIVAYNNKTVRVEGFEASKEEVANNQWWFFHILLFGGK